MMSSSKQTAAVRRVRQTRPAARSVNARTLPFRSPRVQGRRKVAPKPRSSTNVMPVLTPIIGETKKVAKESNFWEDLLKGFKTGTEIAEMVGGLFGGGHGGPHSVSAGGNKWIGVARPTTVRGSRPPRIKDAGNGVYEVTHQGALASVLKKDDNDICWAKGDIMFSIALNPEVEEWLAAIDKYEKFRFLDVAVTYIPSVPTTVTGKLIGYFEQDIDTPEFGGDGEESIRKAMAIPNAAQVDIWTNHTWIKSFRNRSVDDWLYTSASFHEPRMAYQGRFTLMAGSHMTDADLPDNFGDLTITYRIQVSTPSLNNGVAMGQSACYQATSGLTHAGPWVDAMLYPREDQTVDPDYMIPDAVDVTFDTDATFHCAPGYYHISLLAEGTGLSAWTVQTVNGCASVGYGAWETGSSTQRICVIDIKMVEGGTIATTLGSATTLTKTTMWISSLGGSLPFVSTQSLMRRMASILSGDTKATLKRFPWTSPRPKHSSTLQKQRDIRHAATPGSTSSSVSPPCTGPTVTIVASDVPSSVVDAIQPHSVDTPRQPPRVSTRTR